MSPEMPNERPWAGNARSNKNDHDATVSIDAQPTADLAAQLTRRRAASLRLAPLPSGVRDPLMGGRR